MRSLLALLSLVVMAAQAQTLPDRAELRLFPVSDAIVIDPLGPWMFARLDSSNQAHLVALEQDAREGTVSMTVGEAGKLAGWSRPLAIPFDPQRYPIVVLSYRATGTFPASEYLLRLWCQDGPNFTAFESSSVIADGQPREMFTDLRDLDPKGLVKALLLAVRCQGPEPTTFELLGLRFLTDAELPPVEPQEEMELALRVVDSAGKPVAGAEATVDAERLNASRSGLTDAEGRVTLRAMGNAAGAHSVRVAKEGLATVELTTSRRGKLPDPVVLSPSAPYGGTVRTRGGEPVPQALVCLDLRSAVPCWVGKRSFSLAAVTDANGRWTTPPLPATGVSVTVSLMHPDCAGGEVANPPLADMQAGKGVLTIAGGAHIRGKVVGPDDQPVAGAKVALARHEYAPAEVEAKSDANGLFQFPGTIFGKRLLVVTSPQLSPNSQWIEAVDGMGDLLIKLADVQVVRGRVIDSAGKPLAGVTICTDRQPSRLLPNWEDETDADGRFVWHAPAGSLRFAKEGYVTLGGYRPSPGDDAVTVTLPALIRVRGRVTDADTGEPVPSFTVTPGTVYDFHSSGSPGWKPYEAKTFADGAYEWSIDRLSHRTKVALKVVADGYLAAVVPPIALDSGECTFNVELHKGKGPAGVVLLPDGQPANGATVWLVEPGQFLRIGDQAQAGHSTAVSVLTEADGTYQFPSVPGAYLLVALHPQGYAEANAEAYAKSPDLRLQAWARVEGVYRIGAQPAVNQTVSIDADPTRNHYGDPRVVHGWNTGTDDQGRFVFEFVAPGRGRIGGPLVKASAHGYQHSRTAHYSVAPGETAQVTMGGTGRPVVGRAVMPEGAKREFDWSGGAGELVSTIRELPGVQKIPDEFDRLPPQGEAQALLRVAED